MKRIFFPQLTATSSLSNIRALAYTIRQLRLLANVGFFSKTGSDTFRSVLIYGKEEECQNKICHNPAKNHLPERVSP